MRVWLCLLSLGVSSCLCFDSDISYDGNVIDYRTKYRQFLPEILKDIPDPSDESQPINLTEFRIRHNNTRYKNANWFEEDSLDNPAISESKRRWLRRMNPKAKNEYSWECNSSDYRKYQKSLERRNWKEGNTTDVFEDDISDLWDMYMANKTLPPDFPLPYSPPLMFPAYRRLSLSYCNITVPTTQHWLLGPLTGDQGVQYDIEMERYRKYNISKNDPEKVAAADRFLENDMKGKKLNKTKDFVRYFIDLRRRLGVTLNWTRPTISISRELEKMCVPDTEEVLNKFKEAQGVSEEIDPPDIEKYLRENDDKPFEDSGQRKTTKRTTKHSIIKKEQERVKEQETPPPMTMFVYQYNPYHHDKVTGSQEMQEETAPATPNKPEEPKAVKTEEPTRTKKPEPVKTERILTKAPETSTTHKPIQSDISKSEEIQQHPSSQHSSSGKHHTGSTAKPRLDTLSFEEKYRNHTAVNFLHKHKNKFLIGGMACLIAAKVLGS